MGKKHDYIIYTDGGCDVNPGGKGACACVISAGRKKICELSKAYASTTNNRMEMMAVYTGLKYVPKGSSVLLKSDSEYVLRTLQGEYKKKKNLDLWEKLDEVIEGKNVDFKWVAGHSGIKGNERCDELCTLAMKNGPWLTDDGYDGPVREVQETNKELPKGGAMGVMIAVPDGYPEDIIYSSAEEVAKKHTVNQKCAESIYTFYMTGKKRFKDYAGLKVFGTDGWSMMKPDDIKTKVPETEEVIKEAATHMNERNALSAAKWFARGLSFSDAIRRELVAMEIEQNLH